MAAAWPGKKVGSVCIRHHSARFPYTSRKSGNETLTIHLCDPVRCFPLVFALQALLPGDIRALQHRHHPVQQAVHDLEAARLAIPRRCEVPLVPALALPARVLERDVTDLEDPDRHAVMLVLPQRLQQARQQTRAHDLVLRRLGVRELHGGGAVVGAVEEGEVLVVGAEDEGEAFGPAGHGGFEAEDVRELVDGEGGGDGGGDGGEGAWEAVEAVGDGDVFHDVRLVEDVGAGGGDEDVEGGGGVGEGGGGGVGHAVEERADFGGGETEAAAGVDVGYRGGCGAGFEDGGGARLAVVGGVDLDGFDAG